MSEPKKWFTVEIEAKATQRVTVRVKAEDSDTAMELAHDKYRSKIDQLDWEDDGQPWIIDAREKEDD